MHNTHTSLTCRTHPVYVEHSPISPCLAVGRLGLFEQFFDFMSLDHANNNVHNMRLCRLALQHRALSPAAVAERQAAAQVGYGLLLRLICACWHACRVMCAKRSGALPVPQDSVQGAGMSNPPNLLVLAHPELLWVLESVCSGSSKQSVVTSPPHTCTVLHTRHCWAPRARVLRSVC